MPIFKYTLKKYMKSPSTWVIVGISMFLVIVIGGFLPFSLLKPDKPDAAVTYGTVSIALVAGITSFLAIFTSVFAGFKSATMYKDEVEDGTFLVMLSKPITRSKIIFFKWLALQTTIIMYTFIVALSFAVAILVFDNGYKINELKAMGIETLRSKVIMIALALWAILFVVALIFSSIALLLSTRLTVGTTIGISIAIGVIIPITSLVGTFTMKPEYSAIGSSNATTVKALAERFQMDEKEAEKLVDPAQTLYHLGVTTGDKDAFKFAQVFDFNYQIQTLSEFASEQAVPEAAKDMIASSHQSSMKPVKTELVGNGLFPSEKDKQIEQLNHLILNSWKITQPFREKLLTYASLIANKSKIDASHFFKISFESEPEIVINDKNQAISYITKAAANIDAMTVAEGKEYRKDIFIAIKILEVLDTDKNVLPSPSKTDKAALEYGIKLLRPINFWISGPSIEKALADVTTDSTFETKADSLGVLKELVIKEDAGNYKLLISAIQNGDKLVKIKIADYASKWTLLWIYLAIALALVPVSYLAVRKQDFR